MEIERRDFFKNLGRKTAGVAAGVVTPALVHMNSLSDELKALSKDMNGKLGLVSTEVKERIQSLYNRLDSQRNILGEND